ncbi:MAG: chromosomal replication initiator protein DnaA [Candidatus Omnitrophica bacterium]|nr:chromosomal replication initiator protein DnaA [Candidatus Omnitrophota bacterium]
MWAQFQEKVKEKVGKTTFETWFSPIQLKSWQGNKVIAEVPDVFFKDWIEAHYCEVVSGILKELGVEDQITLEVNPRLLQKKTHTVFRKIHAKFKDEPLDSLKLNPRFSFESFVVGPSNHLAYAASRAVSDAPGRIYNPFFIYGKVGLGKTHLIQAIAQDALKKNNARVKYISSERFTNELIGSIQNRSTEKFRQKYRNIDILLIDDVHFIAGKDATQEEFFHTFNVLYDNHKQIIMSSDRPPKEIPNLEERLVSRFCWGLIVDVQPPDLETRVAILKKKIEKEPIKIEDEVLVYIAENITNNTRELEGALVRIMAYSLIENKPISLDMAKNVLRDVLGQKNKKLDIETILEKTADYFNLSKADLKSKKRNKNIVLPKQIAMYLLRELTNYSLPEIGLFLGAKHHTTVLYAHKQIKEKLNKDPSLKNVIDSLKQHIHQ